jgi:glycosyltransferase involved in cell wall biosynthesis
MVGNYRGMGRFARQLVEPISESIIALLPNDISVHELPTVSRGYGFFPWWEQVELPRLCQTEQLDWLICPYNTGPIGSLGSTRTVSIVHDLIFLQPWSRLPPSKSLYQIFGRLYRRQVVPRFVRRADVVVTVSQFSRRQIAMQFGFPDSDIHVIPNSVGDDWFSQPVPQSERKPFLFTVAGEQPSKNVSRLLCAFARSGLWRDHKAILRIAGVKSEHQHSFRDLCDRLGIAASVEFLGFVSEYELKQTYREARGFVFASLFEGFGVPLIEAMACGTKIACSQTTSIPEVVGDAALLFDPYDVDSIASGLRKLWDCSDEDTEKLVRRAHMFSQSATRDTISGFWSQVL